MIKLCLATSYTLLILGVYMKHGLDSSLITAGILGFLLTALISIVTMK